MTPRPWNPPDLLERQRWEREKAMRLAIATALHEEGLRTGNIQLCRYAWTMKAETEEPRS